MNKWVCYLLIGSLISISKSEAQTNPLSDSFDLSESSWLIVPEQDRPMEELEQERNRMEAYIKKPIDINRCSRTDFEEIGILQPVLIDALIRYRETMHGFVDVYELQAVPGMDEMVFQRLKAIITIIQNNNPWEIKRWEQTKNTLELRIGVGIKKTNSNWYWNRENNWMGGPWQHSLRYRCELGKHIRLVLHGEKDAGEKFLFSRKTVGYDFLGGGIQIDEWKGVSKILIGDYLLQWGQGLIQWQGRPPGRQMDVTAIKAQASSPRLQTTNAEQGFHRGFAINWKKFGLQYEGFFSYRKLDARMVSTIDSSGEFDRITGLQASGLHRTIGESSQKGSLGLLTTGIRAIWRKPQYHLSFQSLFDRFNRNWVESDNPYLRFRIPGQMQLYSSIDYSITFRNMHAFGETAWQAGGGVATVHGVIWTVSNKMSCSMLHRHLPNQFTSMHGQPFSETTYRQSERGIYAGLQYKWNTRTQFQVYADIHTFSWFQFRIHGLADGRTCGGSIINTRRKGLTWTLKASYQQMVSPGTTENKSGIVPPTTQIRTRIQAQGGWPVIENLQMHMSVGWQSTKPIEKNAVDQSGMLINMEVNWKKTMVPLTVQAQWIWANTTDFENRMYTQSWSMGGQKTFLPFHGLNSQWHLGLGYRTKNGIRFQLRLTSRYNSLPHIQPNNKIEENIRIGLFYFSTTYHW
jgi:hypothetical protein